MCVGYEFPCTQFLYYLLPVFAPRETINFLIWFPYFIDNEFYVPPVSRKYCYERNLVYSHQHYRAGYVWRRDGATRLCKIIVFVSRVVLCVSRPGGSSGVCKLPVTSGWKLGTLRTGSSDFSGLWLSHLPGLTG